MGKGDVVQLKNWSINAFSDNPYQAPELHQTVLVGEAYGHSRFKDGTIIRTSLIIKSEGRRVFTASGSEYVLRDIDPKYAAWCEKTGISIDEEHPIKIN